MATFTLSKSDIGVDASFPKPNVSLGGTILSSPIGEVECVRFTAKDGNKPEQPPTFGLSLTFRTRLEKAAAFLSLDETDARELIRRMQDALEQVR